MNRHNKKPSFTVEEYRKQISQEINASTIPKQQSGKTNIIQLRNSKTAVKRAKLEHKELSKKPMHTIEKEGMLHQLSHSKARMNVKLTIQ